MLREGIKSRMVRAGTVIYNLVVNNIWLQKFLHIYSNSLNVGAWKPVPPVPGCGTPPPGEVGETCGFPGFWTVISPPFPMVFRLLVDVRKVPVEH